MDDARKPLAPFEGRGVASRVAGRYEKTIAQGEDDRWGPVYADATDDDGAHQPLHPETRITHESGVTCAGHIAVRGPAYAIAAG